MRLLGFIREQSGKPSVQSVLGIAFVVTGVGVGMVFGEFAATRFIGGTAVVFSIVFAFAHEVPIRFGESVIGVVKGWKNAFRCIPLIALGLYTAVNAEKVTCWSPKSKHLCAAKK